MITLLQNIKFLFIPHNFEEEINNRDLGGEICNDYMSIKFKLIVTLGFVKL